MPRRRPDAGLPTGHWSWKQRLEGRCRAARSHGETTIERDTQAPTAHTQPDRETRRALPVYIPGVAPSRSGRGWERAPGRRTALRRSPLRMGCSRPTGCSAAPPCGPSPLPQELIDSDPARPQRGSRSQMLSASCSPWWACLPWRPCAHGDGYQCGWSAGRCGRSFVRCCAGLGMIGDVQQIASGIWPAHPPGHMGSGPVGAAVPDLGSAVGSDRHHHNAASAHRDHNQPGGSHARVRRREQAIRQPPALDACSFCARPGRLTGFLGPNGAGKTTAMRTVFGLVGSTVVPCAGRALPSGPNSGRSSATCRRSVACIRAWVAISSSTSAGSVAVRAGVNQTVDTWLDRLGLSGRAGDRLDALSHGNNNASSSSPRWSTSPSGYHEPFSGLDPLAMGSMSEMLAEVAAAGTTVLFSSHQLDSSRTSARTSSSSTRSGRAGR